MRILLSFYGQVKRTQQVTVVQDTTTQFTVPANTQCRLVAHSTFVPNPYLHHGAQRHLSVLLQLDSVAR